MGLIYKILFYPAKLLWFLTRPEVNAVGAIIEHDQKLLMVRQTYGNGKVWHFPGGLKKNSESAIVSAQREIKEELGIDIDLVEIGRTKFRADFRSVSSTCFYAQIPFLPKLRLDNKEIAESKWWPKDRLPEISEVAKAELLLYEKWFTSK